MRLARLALEPFEWFLLLLAIVVPVLGAGGAAARTPRTIVPHHVLAFYYGWWGTPAGSSGWRHWEGVDAQRRTIANTAHYPQGGVYDSHDRLTLERQFGQMHAAGITGVIASWWGRGSFDDRSLDLALPVARRHGMALTAYYEQVPLPDAATPSAKADAVLGDLTYLLDRHGADPAWLKVGGRPVIFVFRRAIGQLGLDGWWVVNQRLRQRSPAPLLIADVDLDQPTGPVSAAFAGVHAYNNSDHTAGKSAAEIGAWAAEAFPRWTRRWQGRITCLTLIPGFGNLKTGDAAARRPTERHGGATYRTLGEQAIRARPDWLLVTSWNEWHEGTEIEPSDEEGSRALDETHGLTAAFRRTPPRAIALGLR